MSQFRIKNIDQGIPDEWVFRLNNMGSQVGDDIDAMREIDPLNYTVTGLRPPNDVAYAALNPNPSTATMALAWLKSSA